MFITCTDKSCPRCKENRCTADYTDCFDRMDINKLSINFTGKEFEILNEIKDYVPYGKTKLWEWINNFEEELKDKIKNY